MTSRSQCKMNENKYNLLTYGKQQHNRCQNGKVDIHRRFDDTQRNVQLSTDQTSVTRVKVTHQQNQTSKVTFENKQNDSKY